MEAVLRNYRSLHQAGGTTARLIALEDNPPTCTMTYSVIDPGKTSAHHIHPWEHEVYMLEGSGVLVCDGKEYPVTEGDGIFIPGNVDHYTLNNRSSGVIRRIEVNPLIASQSVGARNQGGQGTGQPPVIRNYRDLDMHIGHVLLSGKDGVPTYVMLYNGAMAPGAVSHADTGGAAVLPWAHGKSRGRGVCASGWCWGCAAGVVAQKCLCFSYPRGDRSRLFFGEKNNSTSGSL